MHMQVSCEVVYGQAPKIGIRAAMISQEMSNRLWKEDELLEAMNLGAGTCFLEGVVVGDEENDEDGGDGRW
jgi:hypothetical protein